MPDFGHFDALRRFREALVLDSGRTYAQAQAPFQVARFEAWDVGRRVYCESCTGSSKTTDVAAWILSWVALHQGWQAVIYAVDKEQAAKILAACTDFLLHTPGLRQPPFGLEVQRNRVLSALTSSSCSVDSSDEASAEGLLVDCVICEQLESWKKPALWHAIITRAHKRDGKVIVIANACRGKNDWRYDIRQRAWANPKLWRFFEIDVDEVPWMTPEKVAEARDSVPEAVFRRLYYNEVGSVDESLWPREVVESLLSLEGPAKARSPDIRRLALGVDMGLYHDLAAVALVGETVEGRQRLLNMLAWYGGNFREKCVSIDLVERLVLDWANQYQIDVVVYDEWQFAQAAQHLQRCGIVARKYNFSTKSVSDIVNQLYRRGVDGGLQLYRGAGVVSREGRESDLTDEVSECRMVENQTGLKLETKGDGTKDRLIALGMASLWLARNVIVKPESMPLDEYLRRIGGKA